MAPIWFSSPSPTMRSPPSSQASNAHRRDGCAVPTSGADRKWRCLRARRARAGARIGGFHPLQLFADPDVALAGLRGCTIAIEADAPLLSQLELLAAASAVPDHLPAAGCRARYHAAAHYAAGFVITLLKEAAELWRQSFRHQPRGDGRGTAAAHCVTPASVERVGPGTGPGSALFARGDIGTLEKHLAELGRVGPDALHLYCELALRSIPLGLERGATTRNVPRQCACCCGAH